MVWISTSIIFQERAIQKFHAFALSAHKPFCQPSCSQPFFIFFPHLNCTCVILQQSDQTGNCGLPGKRSSLGPRFLNGKESLKANYGSKKEFFHPVNTSPIMYFSDFWNAVKWLQRFCLHQPHVCTANGMKKIFLKHLSEKSVKVWIEVLLIPVSWPDLLAVTHPLLLMITSSSKRVKNIKSL